MNRKYDNAVSPVVGVMLMLVVVIIIGAIVSAFAGGVVSGQKKAPQATFSGKYSQSEGFRISHDGGDSLATADTVFVVRNGPLFGQNLEQKSAQVLNKSMISNNKNHYLDSMDASSNVSAIIAGETLFITPANTTCNMLQPQIADLSPNLCFDNPDNIGKIFILDVSDQKGTLIATTDVTITS
jgi:archaeal type IV pilus assembly protein PilA